MLWIEAVLDALPSPTLYVDRLCIIYYIIGYVYLV